MSNLDFSLIFGILNTFLTVITLIIFIIFNLWNNKKINKRIETTQRRADERLERSLDQKVILRNRRVQNIFNIFKELIDYMEFSEFKDFDKLYLKCEYRLNIFKEKSLNESEKIKYFLGKIDSFPEDIKYLSIKKEKMCLKVYFDTYIFTPKFINIIRGFSPSSYTKLKSQILADIKSFSKKYYDIELD